jgi:formylglycine-generating enzyme required for sulfatase activity
VPASCIRTVIFAFAAVVTTAAPAAVAQERTHQVAIPAGLYQPFFLVRAAKGRAPTEEPLTRIAAFRIDNLPVTNRQFLAFVRAHPQWRRSQVKPLFADNRYLAKWRSDLELADAEAAAEPVTNVSWFAAEAYCEAQGLALPTTEQWEYALADQGRDRDSNAQRSLEWFSTPTGKHLGAVGRGEPNGYGVYDMVGLVWEWTLDHNSFMLGTEQRNTSSKDDAQVCGGGSVGVRDPADYPAFMRYALRSSLSATYTVDNVGFRCAGDDR